MSPGVYNYPTVVCPDCRNDSANPPIVASRPTITGGGRTGDYSNSPTVFLIPTTVFFFETLIGLGSGGKARLPKLAALAFSPSTWGFYHIGKALCGFWGGCSEFCRGCSHFFGACSRFLGGCSRFLGACSNFFGGRSHFFGACSRFLGGRSHFFRACSVILELPLKITRECANNIIKSLFRS